MVGILYCSTVLYLLCTDKEVVAKKRGWWGMVLRGGGGGEERQNRQVGVEFSTNLPRYIPTEYNGIGS